LLRAAPFEHSRSIADDRRGESQRRDELGVTSSGSVALDHLLAVIYLFFFFLPPFFFAALRFLAIDVTSFLDKILHARCILSKKILHFDPPMGVATG